MVVEGKGSPVGGAADKKAEETFDWLELRRQLDTDRKSGLGYSDSVSATEKFQRKFRENPLVPAGEDIVYASREMVRNCLSERFPSHHPVPDDGTLRLHVKTLSLVPDHDEGTHLGAGRYRGGAHLRNLVQHKKDENVMIGSLGDTPRVQRP